jgi:NADH-quinone oxidoreductase subunit M
MGFVLLGLVTLNQIGVTGAVMQMFSHGIIAGLLFAIVGRIVYERTHTRQLAELETMHLSKRLPFAAWGFVVAGMASMGLPGFSGFVAELQVLVGAWIARPWWALATGVGIVVGVAYTWRAMQKAFFSDALPSAHVLEQEHGQHFAAITWPEVTGVVMLAGVSLWVGLYPRILLDSIEPAVKALLAGGGQ